MLNCMVDGKKYTLAGGEGASLENVIVLMQGAAAERGRIISSFKVNGGELEADGTGLWKASGENCVEITTETAFDMAHQILNQGREHLSALLGTLAQTVGLFRSGNRQMGNDAFIELIGGLELVSGLTTLSASALHIDLSTASYSGCSLEEWGLDLNRTLLEIFTCQEKQDMVLLSDLLEYELSPRLERWREMYAHMQQIAVDTPCAGNC